MSLPNILLKAAVESRGLAIDAIARCHSGHLGLPLGAAEIGAVLFGQALTIYPPDAHWMNRDRFVLSAGHGSMFLYTWLHLSGFALSLAQLKAFRVLHSQTPGHPEWGETPGVEATTGPLGQGIGNAVGMAIAAKMAADRFNTPQHAIFTHRVVCLCGDGCLQEGVSAEAASLAGHLGLDNVILIYDSNDVTLDAPLSKTQSEEVELRFKAYGFDVQTVDGHDIQAFYEAYINAKDKNGKPKMIICKTIIGKGIVEVEGTSKAHGEGGIQFAKEARKALGLPEEPFFVSQEVRDYFLAHQNKQKEVYDQWQKTYAAWQEANPERAVLLRGGAIFGEETLDKIPFSPEETKEATRGSGSRVLQCLSEMCPVLVSGSADLHSSTKNYLKGRGDFSRENPSGQNLYFGIREHAMGAILNGFGYYGIFKASGATFLAFSDYLRPAIRIACLAKLPVFYIFTHDSIGVGEDGPTHQPVETVSALRILPNLDVIRPADSEETAAAFVAALQREDGPTALILTRQSVPNLNVIPVRQRRTGVFRGGYVARRERGDLKVIVIATGSELQLAMKAAESCAGVRVVSMPCAERFDREPEAYRNSVLPSSCRRRIAVEAGISSFWYKYIGVEGVVIGVDQFGLSAPGEVVMREMGMTAERIEEEVQRLLERSNVPE